MRMLFITCFVVIGQQNQKVILLIHNDTSHPEIKLNKAKLIYLPRNKIGGTQPLDAGLYRKFKIKYWQLFLNHLFGLNETYLYDKERWNRSP